MLGSSLARRFSSTAARLSARRRSEQAQKVSTARARQAWPSEVRGEYGRIPRAVNGRVKKRFVLHSEQKFVTHAVMRMDSFDLAPSNVAIRLEGAQLAETATVATAMCASTTNTHATNLMRN